MLLILEDLHWSDASTRELLDYLTRRLRGMRVMVLGTYRADELHRKHPLAHHIQAWRRTKAARVIDLSPLQPEGIAAMVRAIFDQSEVSAEFRDFLHERSEGNPFVLEELLKAAIDSGDIYRTSDRWERKGLEDLRLPQTVRDTILLRLEQLSPEQADILQTASVLGRSFSYPVLVAVSAKDDRTVQAALHTSVQQQLLEEEPQDNGKYRFRHALTREAIYDDMIAPRREELHGVAADVLASRAGTAAIDLAFHLLAANRWDDAVPIGMKAAEEAERNQAHREAAQLYEKLLTRVADGPTRAKLLCRAGTAYQQAQEPARAQRFLEQGIPLLESSGMGVEAAGYRVALGRCYWERSHPAAARAEYEKARVVLETAGPSEALALAYIRLAGLHMFDYEFEQCLATAKRAAEVAEAAQAEPARIWAGVFVGGAMLHLREVDEGLRRIDLAYSEAVARGLTTIANNALYNSSIMRIRMFRAKEAIPRIRLFEPMRVGGRAAPLELFASAAASFSLGDPVHAKELYQQALELARETQSHTFENWIRRELGVTVGALGDPVEGLKLIDPYNPTLEMQDLVLQLNHLMRLKLDAGDVTGAEAHALTVHGRSEWGTSFETRVIGDVAVEALIRAGRVEEAGEIVARNRDGDPTADLCQDRMEGRLALAMGRLEEAHEALARAASGFESAGYVLDEMATRRSLAEAHAKAGDTAAAQAELAGVVRKADAYGAVFEGEQARLQLAALGITSPRATARKEAPAHAEERMVTILFADVRGYTGMVTNAAPADVADTVASFHRWAKQEVERFHGVVDKFAGDAVMAMFNVSGRRLDHTVQAVQAAIAIRDKAGAAGLPVGIGVAVGPAIVGPLTADANVSAIGEVTNIASRLQSQAAAGEVLLSEEAYRRARDWLAEISVEPAEELMTLKGFPEPLKARRLSATRGSSR